MLGLVIAFTIQGFLIFRFITSFLKSKRESKEQATIAAKPLLKKPKSSEKKSETSKKSKKESDLPEADQNVNQKKVKTK